MSLYDHMIVLSREEYRNLKSESVEKPPDIRGSQSQVNNIEVTNGGTILIGRKENIPIDSELNTAVPLEQVKNGDVVKKHEKKREGKNEGKQNREHIIPGDNSMQAEPGVRWGAPNARNRHIEEELNNRSRLLRDESTPGKMRIESQKKRMRDFISERLSQLEGKKKYSYSPAESMLVDSDRDENDDISDMDIDPISTSRKKRKNPPLRTPKNRIKDIPIVHYSKKPRALPPSHPQKRIMDMEVDSGIRVRPKAKRRLSFSNTESKAQKRRAEDGADVNKYQHRRGSKRKTQEELSGVDKKRHLDEEWEDNLPPSPKPKTNLKRNRDDNLEDKISPPSKTSKINLKRKRIDNFGGVRKYQHLENDGEFPTMEQLHDMWAEEIQKIRE